MTNSLISQICWWTVVACCCCTNVYLYGCTAREERFWRSILGDTICMSFMCEPKFLWQTTYLAKTV